MEKDAAESRVKALARLFPFYFDAAYDAPEKRRALRDGFLQGALRALLAAVEWRRDVTPGAADRDTYWTLEELYAACHAVWLSLLGSVTLILEAQQHDLPMPGEDARTTRAAIIEVLSELATPVDRADVKLHFSFANHLDVPSEDRFVPFDLEDVRRVLADAPFAARVTPATTGARRFVVDARDPRLHDPAVEATWKARPMSDTIVPGTLQHLFHLMHSDNVAALRHAVATAAAAAGAVVTLGDLLVRGHELVERMRALPADAQKPSRTSSSLVGTPRDLTGVTRIVHERQPYYGPPEVSKQLSPDHFNHGKSTMEDSGTTALAHCWMEVMPYVMSTAPLPWPAQRACYALATLPPPEPTMMPVPFMPGECVVVVGAPGVPLTSAAALIEHVLCGYQ
jgi:hypothetical protein